MKIDEVISGLQSLRDTLPGHPCKGCELCRRAETLDAAILLLSQMGNTPPVSVPSEVIG